MTERKFIDSDTGYELVIDPEIPGQIGWEALVEMARVAKSVPPNGIIVETGAMFGRSSFVWSLNCDPTVKVFCIDPWVREKWIIDLVEIPQKTIMPFSLDAFKYYTRNCINITAIQGYSPNVVEDWWGQKIDLYFDDSVHAEPGLGKNWNFWIKWVKPGGIFCGDDYGEHCPDVIDKANRLAKEWGTVLHTRGFFWWLRKPARS